MEGRMDDVWMERRIAELKDGWKEKSLTNGKKEGREYGWTGGWIDGWMVDR